MKRLGWILFIFLVVYFIFLIRQDIIDNLDLRKEQERLIKKIEEEKNFAQEMKERIEDLKEGNLVEALARARLGLVKKGETAYKVVN
ncbi:MAG: FtsB family cell division protein [Candidatus Margulisiibacteriota bacterium]